MAETTAEEASLEFYKRINWDVVKYNYISEEDFLKVRSRHQKVFGTFLGAEGQLQFYMFKPLSWGEYKDIRSRGLDKDNTHEYILNACVIWPKFDAIAMNTIEAGIPLALVQQILAMSNFLKDPNEALKMILKI